MVGRMEAHLAAPQAPRASVYTYETFGTTPEGECERPDPGPHRLEQDLLRVLLRLHGQHPIVQVPQVVRIVSVSPPNVSLWEAGLPPSTGLPPLAGLPPVGGLPP